MQWYEGKTIFSSMSEEDLIAHARAKAKGWGLAGVLEAELLIELANRLENSFQKEILVSNSHSKVLNG